MKVILSNGRQFVVKVWYSTEYKHKHVKDKFQRDIFIEWEEHNTSLTITEWFKDKNMTKVTVSSFAHCNYQDQFNKEVGKRVLHISARLNSWKPYRLLTPMKRKSLPALSLITQFINVRRLKNL